jgi:hypothetical protein
MLPLPDSGSPITSVRSARRRAYAPRPARNALKAENLMSYTGLCAGGRSCRGGFGANAGASAAWPRRRARGASLPRTGVVARVRTGWACASLALPLALGLSLAAWLRVSAALAEGEPTGDAARAGPWPRRSREWASRPSALAARTGRGVKAMPDQLPAVSESVTLPPLWLPLPAAVASRPVSRAFNTGGSSESAYVLLTAAVACASLALRSWGPLTASVSSVATPTATPIPTRDRLGTRAVREACNSAAQAALGDDEHGGCSPAMVACFACRCSARSCTALRALISPEFQFRSHCIETTTTDPSASPTGVNRRVPVCRTPPPRNTVRRPGAPSARVPHGAKRRLSGKGVGGVGSAVWVAKNSAFAGNRTRVRARLIANDWQRPILPLDHECAHFDMGDGQMWYIIVQGLIRPTQFRTFSSYTVITAPLLS